MDAMIDELIRECDTAFNDRVNYETQWQEVAELALTSHSDTFWTGTSETKGDKRTQKQFDSTAAIALGRYASICESLITPRNSRWHTLMSQDSVLRRNRQVRLWFEQATDVLFRFREATHANYYSNQSDVYQALGAFGTGSLFLDERPSDGGVRYRSIHIGEVCFYVNHDGIFDTAYRRFKLSAKQAFQKWGDKVPDRVKTSLEKEPHKLFDFIHVVRPRGDYDPERYDAKGKRFGSWYICKDSKSLVQEGGYESFPYAVFRSTPGPGETYGRSPAMQILPAIKVLNEEKKTLIKQGHRAVDPILLAHDDGVLDAYGLIPGKINFGGVSAEGRALVHALPTGNLAVGKDMMDDERFAINEAFFVTLFQILVETPQMTATEVLERAREKANLLGPVLGRLESEALGPMIDRELEILSRQGHLPQMPQMLREAMGEYKVQYDSPLSRMSRAGRSAGAMRLLQSAAEFSQLTQNPEPLDWFNFDVMIPELGDDLAVPVTWMNDMAAVQAKREGRTQQAGVQQMIEAGPSVAAVMKATQPK